MIRPTNIKNIFKKDIKTICLSLGGFYAVFGAFALLTNFMQTMMIPNIDAQPDVSFSNYLNVLHEIWIVFMPLLIILGISYVVFGLLLKKIKNNSFQINLVLSILSLIWVLAYGMSIAKNSDALFAGLENDIEIFKNIAYVFAGFGFIIGLALFTVPQYIIGRKIKSQDIENE